MSAHPLKSAIAALLLVVLAACGSNVPRLDDAPVQGAAPLLEQTPIRYLMCEGVLESIGTLGKQTGLVEEFRRLELRQAPLQQPSASPRSRQPGRSWSPR